MDDLFYITANEEGFKNKKLDELLANGFYRMQHCMFTCNYAHISDEEKPIPVFWLRTQVNNCRLNNAAKTILKKCARFTTNITPAVVNEETEALFALYKKHVPFSISPSAAEYLHQQVLPNPFSPMMVQVRDQDKLVAAGYFDTGYTSLAGIINIYQPSYRTYSPGKFLMLQKLQYARMHGMLFYYTGYISPESNRFNYKVFPDEKAVEIFLPAERLWVPYHLINNDFLAAYWHKAL